MKGKLSMKKLFKSILTIMLSLAMVITLMPMNAHAATLTNFNKLVAGTTSITLDDNDATRADALAFINANYAADNSYENAMVIFGYNSTTDKYIYAYSLSYNAGTHTYSFVNALDNERTLSSFMADVNSGVNPADIYVIGTLSSGYTVTFNANGHGTAPTAITDLSSGSTITEPTAPTETGYTFGGWYKEAACTNAWDFSSDTVTANTELFAKWTPAALVGTVTINGNTKYHNTLTANVTGDNNTGTLSYQWKSNGSNVGTDSQYYVPQASDIGNTITVTVTSTVQTSSIISSATAIIEKEDGPSAPSVTAVACTTAAENDGKIIGTTTDMEYSVSSSFTSAKSCSATETTGLRPNTFYVRYKETATHKASAATQVYVSNYVAPTTYTVTFNANGHGTAPTAISGVTSGATVTEPSAPSENGYTFGGWYQEAECTNAWNFASDTVTANTELFAKWTPATLAGTVTITGTAKYGVTLNVDVSSITNNTGTLSYQWKRDGGNIIGATGSSRYITDADIGHTLSVTVTSSEQTGSITSSATATVEKGDGVLAPSVTAVACATAADNDGKITGTTTNMEYDTSTAFSSPTDCSATETTGLVPGTYYVRLKETNIYKAGAYATVVINAYSVPLGPTTYTVSFDANGGSGTHADVTGVSGPYTLPTTTTFIAPSGKTFDGWSETSGGTKIATTTILVTSAKTLYAVWKDVPAPTPTPAPSTPSEGSSSGSSEASTPSTETKTEVVPVNYSVVKGDTLNKIAKRNGLTLNELLALNPQIKNPNMIYVGQIITLGTTTREVNEKETKAPVTSTKEYIVVKGDSLSRIARRNNISLKELIAKNPQITNINMIYIGQKINL